MQRMLLLITMWVCPALVAQHYPSKPVSMIVAFSPGAAIDLMGRIPPVMAAHPSLPVSNARGLIALARQRPGQLFFSSSGTGIALHLAGELFISMSNQGREPRRDRSGGWTGATGVNIPAHRLAGL